MTAPRVMLAAPASGGGKTTVTCAILRAFAAKGIQTAAFKCGPDYIDPMFHTTVLGTPSRNLDLFLMGEKACKILLDKHSTGADLALLEGVMGFYDGVGGMTSQASSYALAKATDTPVILVVNCRGMSLSAAAVIKGFVEYQRDSHIRGVIFNNLSPVLYGELKEQVESGLPVRVLGYLPPMKDCSLESRHLGLVTAQEVSGLQAIAARLGEQAEKTIDLDGIRELAGEYGRTAQTEYPFYKIGASPRIAVARDKAFCFYYEDNLDLFKDLGAELIPFSPLEDPVLPPCDGIYLGGGYPELYAGKLADNLPMREQIRSRLEDGIPCLAECGGFLYLNKTLEDASGTVYPMVGFFDGRCFPAGRLRRFGYAVLTAREDNLLCRKGDSIPIHEFHYWDCTENGDVFRAAKPFRETSWDCMVQKKNTLGGFPHFHFYAMPEMAGRFLRQAGI